MAPLYTRTLNMNDPEAYIGVFKHFSIWHYTRYLQYILISIVLVWKILSYLCYCQAMSIYKYSY